jgi:hypothetical protein
MPPLVSYVVLHTRLIVSIAVWLWSYADLVHERSRPRVGGCMTLTLVMNIILCRSPSGVRICFVYGFIYLCYTFASFMVVSTSSWKGRCTPPAVAEPGYQFSVVNLKLCSQIYVFIWNFNYFYKDLACIAKKLCSQLTTQPKGGSATARRMSSSLVKSRQPKR